MELSHSIPLPLSFSVRETLSVLVVSLWLLLLEVLHNMYLAARETVGTGRKVLFAELVFHLLVLLLPLPSVVVGTVSRPSSAFPNGAHSLPPPVLLPSSPYLCQSLRKHFRNI